MNEWQCERRDGDGKQCPVTAIGVGGAIGLRAIGWQFPPEGSDKRGALRCPTHRTDRMPRRSDVHPETDPDHSSCACCAGETEAEQWQAMIVERMR